MKRVDWERARHLLLALEETILDAVLRGRQSLSSAKLAAVAKTTAADTIYGIDRVGEDAVSEWLNARWPKEWPVELVMEGSGGPTTFPPRTPPDETRFKLIVDPIDGTRNIMYDKRSAWVLAGLAPQHGPGTRLSHIAVAAMTEIPVTKQTKADQVSAIRRGGRVGIKAERIDLAARPWSREPLAPRPSRASDFRHGFASFARFFPDGKALMARIEEELWKELYGLGQGNAPLVFEDQYISTGGQFYELLAGRDRMLGDLRPLLFAKLGLDSSLVCHPYDVAAALLLEEAGIVLESPLGGPVDPPLDTVSPVAWIAFANKRLAALARPILQRLIVKELGGAPAQL